MRLILFRHGPAGSADPARWPDDGARPLTPKGAIRTRSAARGLRRIERKVDAILSSPLVRAKETARLLSGEMPAARLKTLEALVPGTSVRRITEALVAFSTDDTLVLVGHEPDLGRLAGTWLSRSGAIPLKKAGACAIHFEGAPAPGTGTLEWMLGPRILRRLGAKKAQS